MLSLLDIVKKNPLSRLPFTHYKSIKLLRKKLSEKILRYDKFGRLINCPEDLSQVSQEIDNKFYKTINVYNNLKDNFYSKSFNLLSVIKKEKKT